MLIWLPRVLVFNDRPAGLGEIRQIGLAERQINVDGVRFSSGRNSGHQLNAADGRTMAYVFARKPTDPRLPTDAPIAFGAYDFSTAGPHDLRALNWLSHPLIDVVQLTPVVRLNETRGSWRGAFQFIEEDPAIAEFSGLRRPQIGALHAIHAHWSVSEATATIVMPTGTGKTETMLCTLVSALCDRILVVVPTDALRTQIASKFETLGVLRSAENKVLHDRAMRPVVGTLTSRPKSQVDVDAFFAPCNVVVTSSSLIGGCSPEVQERIAHHCSHLFIDEAHHAEARTWKAFRDRFKEKRTLQFTATPFREDGQRVDGNLIYVYPLKKAQQEGYFRPIRFRRINEFGRRGDAKIAEAAVDELDKDSTGKHIVMARVANIERAEKVLQIYQLHGRYSPVALHSGMKVAEREAARAALLSGTSRIVVCVDMLGEGFDLPELKIAAFHDIRKSLAVTLQLAGRFTRARPDLGNPVFIANTALVDVREELQSLYSQDPDWNALLPTLATTAIENEITSQRFFGGFSRSLNEIPLHELSPSASMVVYKTKCDAWTPQNFKKGFRGLTSRDHLFSSLNEHERTLVIVAALERGIPWSGTQSIRDNVWELFIAVWDTDNELLYLHGSANSGEYQQLAKVLCGADVALMIAPDVYRCFHGIKRLMLNNVGLNEHLGRQLRYTGMMGSDVESRIGTAARRKASKAVLAGRGYEAGRGTSAGAAKRGRVWSNQRLRIDSFVQWSKSVGIKLANDQIDPEAVLKGTLKPEAISSIPTEVAIVAEWPLVVIQESEGSIRFHATGYSEETTTTVDIEVAPRDDDGPLIIRVSSERWEAFARLELSHEDGVYDFAFANAGGTPLTVRHGSTSLQLEEFFTEFPPVVWFADGSSLEGCQFTRLGDADLLPFPAERLREIDWTGVNINSESQGEAKNAGTIQHRLIQILQRDPTYSVIFDDDAKGEAADIVAISEVTSEGVVERIEVELYHLKFAHAGVGNRVDDLYEVCGQAQRCVNWCESPKRTTNLFAHMLRRNASRTDAGRSTRFERGDQDILGRIRDLSRQVAVRFQVFIVQPGLSKAGSTANQMRLLAVTERYLSDTYEMPLGVLCSP